MRLQAELERKKAGIECRSTKNEQKAAMRVEAERRGDWVKFCKMYRRDEKICAQKYLERQAYLACKR